MVVTPLREAGDVAVRTLSGPFADAFDLVRHGRVWPRGAQRIGWDVVNLDVDGRVLRYRVTDNTEPRGGTRPTWAMSLHGYFAGGSMYARESEHLATRMGWRLVNPSLPGFGGSDPLPRGEVTMSQLTDDIGRIREHLGIGRMVLLGHSMGAAIAVRYAAAHQDDVLGVLYRDGVATPDWQHRHGAVARILGVANHDVANVADFVASAAMDLPDLLAGQLLSTIRALIPDLAHNVRMLARHTPVASMLMSLDLSDDVRALRSAGVPLLAEWGCFDHLVPTSTASEFAAVAGMEVHFVPGGHSWMLARPSGQADVLHSMSWGRDFVEALEARQALLDPVVR